LAGISGQRPVIPLLEEDGNGERPPGVPPEAIELFPDVWQAVIPGTDRIGIYEKDVFGQFTLATSIKSPSLGGDSAESIRHNKAMEALGLRQLSLDTARVALTGYLDATKDIASRRKGALETAQGLLPFLVDPSQEFFSGLGPGGLLSSFSEEFDLPFDPVRIQHKQLRPGAIAQEGPLSPEIAAMLEGIRNV